MAKSMVKQSKPKRARPIRLYFAILNKGWVRREMVDGTIPIMQNTKGVKVTRENLTQTWGEPICHNRNNIRLRFLAHRPKQDFLIMIDCDVIPYANPALLVFANKDIVGMPAKVRQGQSLNWVAYMKHPEEEKYASLDFGRVDDRVELLKVDAIGTGLICIKRHVMEKIEAPFTVIFDKNGLCEYGTDFAFSKRAREAGFDIYTTPNRVCEHMKEVGLLDIMGFDDSDYRDPGARRYSMPWGGWSITQKDWYFLRATLEKLRTLKRVAVEKAMKKKAIDVKELVVPMKVLEFGCGLSSLMLSESADVISYEANEEFAGELQKKIDEFERKTLKIRMWDAKKVKEKLGKFDLIFVDGPVGVSSGGPGRQHSLRIASEIGDNIVVHDAGRADETFWQNQYLRGKFKLMAKSGHHQTRCQYWRRREKKFTCRKCGHCCILPFSAGLYALLTAEEKASGKYKTRFHPDVGKNWALAKKRIFLKELGRKVWACYHYDEEKKCCTIYEDRPNDCRRFYCETYNMKEKWEKFEKNLK